MRPLTGFHIAIDGLAGSQAETVSRIVAGRLYNRRRRVVRLVSAFSPDDLVLPCSEWGVNERWLSPLTKFGFLFGQYLQAYVDCIEPTLLSGGVVVSHKSLRAAIVACSINGNGKDMEDIVAGYAFQRRTVDRIETRLDPDLSFWIPSERKEITAHVQKHWKALGKIEAKEYNGDRIAASMRELSTVVPFPASDEAMADSVCNKIYTEFPSW